jgi:hypothetical protein
VRASRQAQRRCRSPPRSSRAARRDRGSASVNPRRSRCRQGIRVPPPRGSARACKASTSSPRWQSGGTPHHPHRRRRSGPRAARSLSPLPSRAPGRPARCASPAGRPAASRTRGGGGRDESLRRCRGGSRWWHRACSQAVWLTIRMIAWTPRPSSPTSCAARAMELHLGARQRAGSELVLEPLELHPGPRSTRKQLGALPVAGSVRAPGRRRTAGRSRTTCARAVPSYRHRDHARG